MTSQDFQSWLAFHGTRFPGFEDWRLGMSPHEPQEIVESRESEWFSALADFTHSQMRDASVRLQRSAPRTFGEHLAALLRLLRAPAQESFEPDYGRYAHRCGLCNETGYAYALPRSGYQTKPSGLPAEFEWMTVACTCEQGTPIANRQNNPLPRFNPATMISIFTWRREWYRQKQAEQNAARSVAAESSF